MLILALSSSEKARLNISILDFLFPVCQNWISGFHPDIYGQISHSVGCELE